MKPVQRFFESIQVDPQTSCWVWKRTRGEGGYGKFYDGRFITASRWAYAFFIRPIAPGYSVCHRCDNPPCVNPRHLFQGTQNDNFMDAVGKKRILRKLTDKQVRQIRKLLIEGVKGSVLSQQYGVRRESIYDLKHGRTYKWVE